jgi:hypothetical protein
MAPKDRERLWQRALELDLARDEDFAPGRRPPADSPPENLRVIADTALRTRLIEARIAEGLQSPKGPQKIKSILRLYPGFDAPGPNGAAAHGRTSPQAAPVRGRAARKPAAHPPATRAPRSDRPTIEEMRALLDRLGHIEAAVAHELQADFDEQLRALQAELASANGDALERLHAELGRKLETRRTLRAHSRAEAFTRIERELDARGRAHLRLLSTR